MAIQACFRGRPAGFYEVYQRVDKIGIIIQKLSNQLDSGEVLYIAHSKIHHHSYKKTVQQFYKNSRYMLRKALDNYTKGETIATDEYGPNYRLQQFCRYEICA